MNWISDRSLENKLRYQSKYLLLTFVYLEIEFSTSKYNWVQNLWKISKKLSVFWVFRSQSEPIIRFYRLEENVWSKKNYILIKKTKFDHEQIKFWSWKQNYYKLYESVTDAKSKNNLKNGTCLSSLCLVHFRGMIDFKHVKIVGMFGLLNWYVRF